MKTAIFQFTLLAFLALCSIGHCETTNSFGIYRTVDPAAYYIVAQGKGDVSGLHLTEPPLISEADIISYDFSNHVITLKPEALARAQDRSTPGAPFVVVADWQRIYVGEFTTCISSFVPAIPSITVDFSASFPNLATKSAQIPNLLTNILVINPAYRSPSSRAGSDPRGDLRIKSALKALHKLKNDK